MLSWTNPRKVGNDYYFRFRDYRKNHLSPIDAAKFTVQYIVENYPGPYTLYLSGGVDSQAMLYAWHISGVPYNTFSGCFNQKLNDHDTQTLREFASQHNINVNYHDFDILSFLENDHDHYANEYYCGSPQITSFMKMADLTKEGTVIFSGQFIMKGRNLGLLGVPDRNNFSLYNYGIKANKSIVPFFFLETCELAYAFNVDIPEIRAVHEPGSYTDKVKAYQYYGFPVIAQDTKYNGFEEIKKLYDVDPPRIPTTRDRLIRIRSQTSSRNFDLLYRNKYEAKFFHYKYFIC